MGPNKQKRPERVVRFQGRSQSLSAWAKELGLAVSTLSERIANGWSIERALTEPVRETGMRMVSKERRHELQMLRLGRLEEFDTRGKRWVFAELMAHYKGVPA